MQLVVCTMGIVMMLMYNDDHDDGDDDGDHDDGDDDGDHDDDGDDDDDYVVLMIVTNKMNMINN